MPPLGRRHLLSAAGLSLLGSVALRRAWLRSSYEPPESNPDDSAWHRPRRDAGNTAATTQSGPRTDGELGWQYRDQPMQTDHQSGFVRYDDTVLVADEDRLSARDVTSGERQWTFRPAEYRSIDSSPRVRNETVFLAVGGIYVVAVDCESRRPRWRYRTNGSVHGLTLAGNTLCFSSYVDGHRTIALDTETGYERWRTTGSLTRTAASGDRLIGRNWGEDALTALDLETGSTLWTRDSNDTASLPSIRSIVGLEDRVVVAGHGGVAVLDAATGETRTTIDRERGSGPIAVDSERERVVHSDPASETIERVGLDGTRDWTVTAPVDAGLAIGDDTVYTATTDGLLALDAADGSERFAVSLEFESTQTSAVTPLVTSDAVYHRHGDVVYQVHHP